MRDGQTRRLKSTETDGGIEQFLSDYRAKVVVVAGNEAGSELELDRPTLLIGRGPGVDMAFDDPAMSRQHAAIEFAQAGFRIRDLGSTNGLLLNGRPVQVGELSHGDRVEIGARTFQLVIEEREQAPDVYELEV
jgi:pSer/pThr/pTyr-binding forkhead associated (FHA) protein